MFCKREGELPHNISSTHKQPPCSLEHSSCADLPSAQHTCLQDVAVATNIYDDTERSLILLQIRADLVRHHSDNPKYFPSPRRSPFPRILRFPWIFTCTVLQIPLCPHTTLPLQKYKNEKKGLLLYWVLFYFAYLVFLNTNSETVRKEKVCQRRRKEGIK